MDSAINKYINQIKVYKQEYFPSKSKAPTRAEQKLKKEKAIMLLGLDKESLAIAKHIKAIGLEAWIKGYQEHAGVKPSKPKVTLETREDSLFRKFCKKSYKDFRDSPNKNGFKKMEMREITSTLQALSIIMSKQKIPSMELLTEIHRTLYAIYYKNVKNN